MLPEGCGAEPFTPSAGVFPPRSLPRNPAVGFGRGGAREPKGAGSRECGVFIHTFSRLATVLFVNCGIISAPYDFSPWILHRSPASCRARS